MLRRVSRAKGSEKLHGSFRLERRSPLRLEGCDPELYHGRAEGLELFVPCNQELLVGLSPRQAALPRRLLQGRLAIHAALLHDFLYVSGERHCISRVGGVSRALCLPI